MTLIININILQDTSIMDQDQL